MDKQYTVKITQYAEQSMREIAQYIAFDLMAPQTAVHFIEKLRSEINSLNLMPNRIPLAPEEPWHQLGVHRMLVQKYYVYFWVDEGNNSVHITDVTYVRRKQQDRLAAMTMDD